MGQAPPPDGPPLASADAGFSPSPSAASLCGFKFPPTIFFKFGFNLPPIAFPPKLPSLPSFTLALNCNVNNPLSISGPPGGGRVSNAPPNPDLDTSS